MKAQSVLRFRQLLRASEDTRLKALSYSSRRAKFSFEEKNQAWPSLIDLYRALVFFNEGRFFEARQTLYRSAGCIS